MQLPIQLLQCPLGGSLTGSKCVQLSNQRCPPCGCLRNVVHPPACGGCASRPPSATHHRSVPRPARRVKCRPRSGRARHMARNSRSSCSQGDCGSGRAARAGRERLAGAPGRDECGREIVGEAQAVGDEPHLLGPLDRLRAPRAGPPPPADSAGRASPEPSESGRSGTRARRPRRERAPEGLGVGDGHVGRVAARRAAAPPAPPSLSPGRAASRAPPPPARPRRRRTPDRASEPQRRQLAHLLLGQRGAHRGDRLDHPGLVQRQDVGVALDHDRPALARRSPCGRGRARTPSRTCERARPRASSGTWAARRRASAGRRSRAPGRGRRPAGTSAARGTGRPGRAGRGSRARPARARRT